MHEDRSCGATATYARTVALLSVPAAYWLELLTLEQLYAVALFSGLLAVFQADASAGAIGAAFAIGNIGFVAAALLAQRLARRFGVGPGDAGRGLVLRPGRAAGRRRSGRARRRRGRRDGPWSTASGSGSTASTR